MCFTSHMSQQHDKAVYMDTELPLEAIRKYNSAHSPICSKMKSDLIAVKRQLISEQKRAANVLRKTAKLAEKAAAKVPAKKGKKNYSCKSERRYSRSSCRVLDG